MSTIAALIHCAQPGTASADQLKMDVTILSVVVLFAGLIAIRFKSVGEATAKRVEGNVWRGWWSLVGQDQAVRWWKIRTSSGRRDTLRVNDLSKKLTDYLKRPVAFIARSFLAAWLCWFLFYACLLYVGVNYPEPVRTPAEWSFILNLLSNGTTFFIVLLYFKLSAHNHHDIAGWEFRRMLLVGWTFLLGAVMSYEFLVTLQEHVVVHDSATTARNFKVIYGLAQSLAIFLLIGRLESMTIRDHIFRFQRSGLKWYKRHLIMGYLFAAIQPLYPAFDADQRYVLPALVFVALVGKVSLFCLLRLLFTPMPSRTGISPMQHYLYETERFTVEEDSHFERKFLKKHFPHMDRAEHLEHEKKRQEGHPHNWHERAGSPRLGVEYETLNDFKRFYLGFENEPHGIWVTRVTRTFGNDEDVLVGGEYITHIDGEPMGRNNRLRVLLKDYKVGDVVELRGLWRVPPRKMPAGGEPEIKKFKLLDSETLPISSHHSNSDVKLGVTFLHNSPEHGVVCCRNEDMVVGANRKKAGAWECTVTALGIIGPAQTNGPPKMRRIPTPDIHMLKLAMDTLRAEDKVKMVIRM